MCPKFSKTFKKEAARFPVPAAGENLGHKFSTIVKIQ